jgi:hypothetical protein
MKENINYTIIKPTHPCGMCGQIWQVLRTIYSTPNEKYYIDLTNSIYKKEENIKNNWDDYFEQPFTGVYPQKNEIKQTLNTIFKIDNEFIHEQIQPNDKQTIKLRRLQYHNLIKKYVKPKQHILDKIEKYVDIHFTNSRILGVHLRGTDHPNKQPIEKCILGISYFSDFYDKIFVCSDEQERFNTVQKTFPEKVIGYNATRSSTEAPLHSGPGSSNNRNNDPNYQYKIAEDVIIEAYIMSKTNFLICTTGSNVNYLARVINPDLDSVTFIP